MKQGLRLIFLCIIISYTSSLQAQLMMLAGDADYIDYLPTLRKTILEECSDTLNSFLSGGRLTAYTYHQNGIMYSYGHGLFLSNPPGSEPIPNLDLTRLARTANGYNFTSSTPQANFNQDTTIQAIATGLDSVIYAAGTTLWSFAPNTGVVAYRGAFPPEWRAEGGMTLREGELYMTTVNNDLLRLDRDDPSNSQLIHTFPDSITRIESLVTIPYTCDSIITYAFAPLGGFMDSTMIYELSFEDYSLTPVCMHQEPIIAAAAMEEIMIPPCELYADLDAMDDTTLGLDFVAPVSCSAPISITASTLEVFGQIELDSLVLELDGILDAGQEYLSGIANSAVGVQPNALGQLVLYNLGGATLADFEAVLASVQYQNDATSPTYGQRQITVTPYALYYVGVQSVALINLDNSQLSLDVATQAACFMQANGVASLEGDGGISPYDYLWDDGTLSAMRNDLLAGDYPFTLTDAEGCYLLDTIAISENDSLYAMLSANTDSICGNSGQIVAMPMGGTSPYTYTWNSILGNATLSGIGAGNYDLLLTDSLGCTAMESYTLYSADTIFINESFSTCEGDPIIWQGQTYLSDTTICTSSITSFGCDSIYCAQLIFLDTFYQEEQYVLCQGEVLNWQGNNFSQDTSLCITYFNNEGCDSTYCLDLSYISRISNITADICEGESYLFAGEEFTVAGIYYDTISDGGICDSINILELNTFPLPNVSISTDGSLCSQEQITLSASTSTQGQYLWSTGATTPSITIESAGTYTISFTDANACIAIDSLSITESSPELIFSSTDPNCPTNPNGSIQIDSVWGGEMPYLFALNNSVLQSTTIFSVLESGEYTLTIEDVEGCSRSYPIILSNQSNLSFELGEDVSLKLGESVSLNPITNALSPQIQWQPPLYLDCDTCLNPIATPLVTTLYQASVTDESGCILTDDITLRVDQKTGLFIPNAFSPNDDGRNDRLFIYADASVISIENFQIFNRWGGLVYERNDFLPNLEDDLHWDGRINGELAAAGVYTYQIGIQLINGQQQQKGGTVHLLR